MASSTDPRGNLCAVNFLSASPYAPSIGPVRIHGHGGCAWRHRRRGGQTLTCTKLTGSGTITKQTISLSGCTGTGGQTGSTGSGTATTNTTKKTGTASIKWKTGKTSTESYTFKEDTGSSNNCPAKSGYTKLAKAVETGKVTGGTATELTGSAVTANACAYSKSGKIFIFNDGPVHV